MTSGGGLRVLVEARLAPERGYSCSRSLSRWSRHSLSWRATRSFKPCLSATLYSYCGPGVLVLRVLRSMSWRSRSSFKYRLIVEGSLSRSSATFLVVAVLLQR